MSEIEALSQGIVISFLDREGMTYLVDRDGDPFVIFAATDARPEVQASMCIEGGGSIYVVRVFTPERFGAETENLLVGLANRWNREHRWPKAIVGAPTATSTVRVWTEMQLPCATGVHRELVADFTGCALDASSRFFVWLADQQTLPTVEQLEQMFREAS